MQSYPEHIVNEFAEIFEKASLPSGELDMSAYCQYRDDFYQVVRSNIAHDVEQQDEIELRFQRPPVLNSPILFSFAAGNAEYYADILGIDVPEWCSVAPPLSEDEIPYFPFPRIISDPDAIIENTPIELYNRGFAYDKHNFVIY